MFAIYTIHAISPIHLKCQRYGLPEQYGYCSMCCYRPVSSDCPCRRSDSHSPTTTSRELCRLCSAATSSKPRESRPEYCVFCNGKTTHCMYLAGTCEASRFDSNWTSRFNSIRKWRADSKILNRHACHVCRRTINNTHCSTTNFNRFGIATGIYIEFN